MEIKNIIADIKNTHDYENIEDILGDELGNKIAQLLKLCDGLPNNAEQALTIPDVSQQSGQLVNFLWEQYKVKRLITKKVYMQMVVNARKLS